MARPLRAAAVAEGLTGSRSLLRRMNSWGVLRAVMERSQTMRDLAAASGLSRTAIDAIVADLVTSGWLASSASAPSGSLGRPAATYQLTPRLGHFLSLDIGANHIFAIVTDLAGNPVGQRAAQVAEDAKSAGRIAAAVTMADELLASIELERRSLWTVAVGSPGSISADGRVLHFGGTGMPGWVGLDLRSIFGGEFGTAVLVEGDVALGAEAELTIGAARGHSDVVYILSGKRTSGASIVDGKVHRGVHGAAGIVGEMPELRWSELAERPSFGAHDGPEDRARFTRQEMFERARSGDPDAVAAVNSFADSLATGAAAMSLAIDPELLVIGGGSSPAADVFLPRFTEALRRAVPLAPAVVASTLGSEAVAIGGISLARKNLASTLEAAVRGREAFPSPPETLKLLTAASRR